MMVKQKFRVQLASNFQVVDFELEVDSIDELTEENETIQQAVMLVNALGKAVGNDVKPSKNIKKSSKPKENQNVKRGSEGQIAYAISLGLDKEKANSLSSGELWKWINENK